MFLTRKIHEVIYFEISNDVPGEEFDVFGLYLKIHANMAPILIYYQRMRGEMDFDDDTEDLRTIIKKKWVADMGSKKNWIQTSIDSIDKAHNEYFNFTLDVSDSIDSYLVDNEAIGTDAWVRWGKSLEEMVLENHDRDADFNELACMRSFSTLLPFASLWMFLSPPNHIHTHTHT